MEKLAIDVIRGSGEWHEIGFSRSSDRSSLNCQRGAIEMLLFLIAPSELAQAETAIINYLSLQHRHKRATQVKKNKASNSEKN